MTDPIGGQTVDFVKISDGARDRLNIPAKVETVTPVPNCLFQPFSSRERSGVREDNELVNIATEQFRCTVRPDLPVTLTMTPNDYLRYEGKDYKVVGGSRLNRDFEGNIDHVLIVCERDTA